MRWGVKMKKFIRLLAVFIAIIILTACSKSKPDDRDKSAKVNKIPVVEVSKDPMEEVKEISPPDLSSEEGVREYLVGEWTCNIEYMSNVMAHMTIYEDLNLELSFYDLFTNEAKGDYKGSVKFKRIYRDQEDPPDMITLELDDDDYEECDYFLMESTIYDGKRVMSLFFAGLEKSVFDILTGDDDLDYSIGEVMFEKVTGEVPEGKLRKNDEFYAIFWGHGGEHESIWIDDVEWTPPEGEDAYDPNYPVPRIRNENEETVSLLYKIAPDKQFDILGDDMFKGEAYYIETDEKANIVELINAEYKRYLEESSDDYMDVELKNLVYNIVFNNIDGINEYMDMGMTLLFTGETTIIDGEECYDVVLGTDHEESFVREIYYTVNISTEQVYRYDVLDDIWEFAN